MQEHNTVDFIKDSHKLCIEAVIFKGD